MWCSKCQVDHPPECFSKNRAMRNGYSNWCKVCMSRIQKERYRYAGKPLPTIQPENTFPAMKTCSTCKVSKARCEFGRDVRRKDQLDARCKVCLCKKGEVLRAKLRLTPEYRVRCTVSSAIARVLHIHQSSKLGESCFKHLPYTKYELVAHLEQQFTDGMSWDNYGTYWQVDHIIPQAYFSYTSLDSPDFQKCWALTNLRPLKSEDNRNKSSIYEGRKHFYREVRNVI